MTASEIQIISNEEVVEIFLPAKNSFNTSTASASFMGNHWFINRVLVNPQSDRGKGIGSKLLQVLIKEIKKQNNKKIIVTPGGYINNTKQQINFYVKNGFKKTGDCFTLIT